MSAVRDFDDITAPRPIGLDPVDCLVAPAYARSGRSNLGHERSALSLLQSEYGLLEPFAVDGLGVTARERELLAWPRLIVATQVSAVDGLIGRLLVSGEPEHLIIGHEEDDRFIVTGRTTAQALAAQLGEQCAGDWLLAAEPELRTAVVAITSIQVAGDAVVSSDELTAFPPAIEERPPSDIGPSAAAELAAVFEACIASDSGQAPASFDLGPDLDNGAGSTGALIPEFPEAFSHAAEFIDIELSLVTESCSATIFSGAGGTLVVTTDDLGSQIEETRTGVLGSLDRLLRSLVPASDLHDPTTVALRLAVGADRVAMRAAVLELSVQRDRILVADALTDDEIRVSTQLEFLGHIAQLLLDAAEGPAAP